jgi:hypothetical protein
VLDRAAWLILGVALGALGSTYLYSSSDEQRSDQPKSVQVETTSSSESLVSEAGRTPLEINSENINGNRQPHLDLEDTVAVPASNIPTIYSEVIGLPRPKRPRFADRHAIFLTEPRDEVWASTMESGISNFLADNASNLSFKVEFVECRSEHCEIAGYVPEGYPDDTGDLKNGLRNSGWWQGGLSSSSTGREINGVQRIVIIFNRNIAWTTGKSL